MATDKEILEAIKNWAYTYPSYLSESVDYARGYKAGIVQAQEIVKNFLNGEII